MCRRTLDVFVSWDWQNLFLLRSISRDMRCVWPADQQGFRVAQWLSFSFSMSAVEDLQYTYIFLSSWHWRCDMYSLLWFCTIYYCLLHSLLVVLHAIWHEFDVIKVCALVVMSLFPLFEVKAQRICISFGSVSQVLGSAPSSVVRKYSLEVQVTHDSHKCKDIITDIAVPYSCSQAQRAQIRLLTLQQFQSVALICKRTARLS